MMRSFCKISEDNRFSPDIACSSSMLALFALLEVTGARSPRREGSKSDSGIHQEQVLR